MACPPCVSRSARLLRHVGEARCAPRRCRPSAPAPGSGTPPIGISSIVSVIGVAAARLGSLPRSGAPWPGVFSSSGVAPVASGRSRRCSPDAWSSSGARAARVGRRVVVGVRRHRRLERPAEHRQHEDRRTDDGDHRVVDDAVADDRQREGERRAASTTATAGGCGGRRWPPARRGSPRPWPPGAGRGWSPSPTSSYLRWKNSSRACTVGSASKLCSFGGLVVIHSSVRASHGSSGAAGCLAVGVHDVDEEEQDADGEDERADRRRRGSRSRG